jgi:hypothetical protein
MIASLPILFLLGLLVIACLTSIYLCHTHSLPDDRCASASSFRPAPARIVAMRIESIQSGDQSSYDLGIVPRYPV